MNKHKLNILLVDDSYAVNFYNKNYLENSGICNEILESRHGQEAIELLNKMILEKSAFPDIIFLDLNMPVMDGWRFLERYEEISDEIRNKTAIYILTTSVNPAEKERAEKNDVVDKYYTKPINKEILDFIIKEHQV